MNKNNILLSAALAGLMGAASGQALANSSPKKATEAKKVKCWGVNACGAKHADGPQGACGSKYAGNSCAGQNACAGHGWLQMTEAECLEKKGLSSEDEFKEKYPERVEANIAYVKKETKTDKTKTKGDETAK